MLVDRDGEVVWIQDCGAPEHRGVMHVATFEIASEVAEALGR